MTKREDREEIRRLLNWWGVTESKRLRLQQRLRDIEDSLDAIIDAKASPLTGMPRGSSTSDKTARAAEKHDREAEWYRTEITWIKEDLDALNKWDRAISKAINSLDPIQSMVIELRYKRMLGEKPTPFSEIASSVSYSQSRIEQIEKDAVDELAKLVKFDRQ